MTKKLLLSLVSVTGLHAGDPCVPVTGDWITARDVGQVDAAFLSLDGATPLLRSPQPGTPRYLATSDLVRLASKWKLESQASRRGGCFEYPTAPLTAELIRQTIHAALTAHSALPQAESLASIEVIEWPRELLPVGQLRFDLSRRRTASSNQAGPGSWVYGELSFLSARKVPLWVKVHVRTQHTFLVATTGLQKGARFEPDHVRAETREVDWLEYLRARERPVHALDSVLGQQLATNVRPGTVLTENLLRPAIQIQRGELVELEVVSGLARIRLPARAEGRGAIGEPITVRIDKGTRNLAAVVVGPRSARILTGRPAADAIEE